MTENTNTDVASAADSAISGQKGSIAFLSVVFAVVRTLLVIVGSISVGPSIRYLFPEMFVISQSPLGLLAVVFVDTFIVAFLILLARAKKAASKVR